MDRSTDKSLWDRVCNLFGGRSGDSIEQAVMEARDEGELDLAEGSMILSILRLDDVQVQDIMTPRTDFDCMPTGAPVSEVAQCILETGHSRLPIYKDTRDNIIGIAYAKDLISLLVDPAKHHTAVDEIMRSPFFVPETKIVSERRLEDRSPSAQAGMELRLLSPYGMFHASGAGDVLSRSNGFNGDIGFIQSIEFGPLELLPAVGAYWSDARYNSYYYGVTRKEARKSGLGAYAPGSGFAPYVSFAIDYSLTEQWELFCQGEVTFLSGAVKDSPMVGETHTQSLTLGLTYTF